jgi:hypothetical protein
LTVAAPKAPKSLRDPAALAWREGQRHAPHLRALRPYLDRLRREHGEVPDPDPLDGGASARLLVLLETPGPRIRGTRFVSRDNPTGTAANLFRYLKEAGIPRDDTLIWNAIPWVIHSPGARNRAPRPAEVRAGLGTLPDLLSVLDGLRAVVLAGRTAGQARPVIGQVRPMLRVIDVPHPSPTYVCTSPEVGRAIGRGFAAARSVLDGGD